MSRAECCHQCSGVANARRCMHPTCPCHRHDTEIARLRAEVERLTGPATRERVRAIVAEYDLADRYVARITDAIMSALRGARDDRRGGGE